MCEKTFGPEDRALVRPLHQLAELLIDRQQNDQAKVYLARGLKVLGKNRMRNRPPAHLMLWRLGWIHTLEGRLAEGEEMLKEAWEVARKHLGQEDNVTTQIEYSLAETLLLQAKYAEAQPLSKHLLEYAEERSGPESLDVFPSLLQLATIELAYGRLDTAEELYRRALTISRQAELLQGEISLIGGYSPGQLTKSMCLSGLAGVARRRQRYDQAAKGDRELLDMAQEGIPEDDPRRLGPMFGLAVTLHAKGQVDEARQLQQQWLKRWREEEPRGASETRKAIVELGDLAAEKGQNSVAESIYWTALMPAVVESGPDHEDVRTLLTKLARVIRAQDRSREADAIEALTPVPPQE
jgi:tetratricopeptide (TPR) repeat protein